MPRPCACRFAPYPHNDDVCREARKVPTRSAAPDKPKPRARFKPGERGNRRGIIHADDSTR